MGAVPESRSRDGCHDGLMPAGTVPRSGPVFLLVRGAAWLSAPLLAVGTYWFQAPLGSASMRVEDGPFVLAFLACWLVGVVVTLQQPRQRAGWAFLGLGTALAWTSFTDAYAESGLDGPHHIAGDTMFATLSDSSFVWWFAFLALVLQLTPPDPPRHLVARWLPSTTLTCALVFQVMALLRPVNLDPPRDKVVSPLALTWARGPTVAVAAVAIYALGLCLLASVVVLVQSWRRSSGDARRQLLWLAAGAAPLFPAVIGAFVASIADHNDIASVLLSVAITLLVLGAALSVVRYRLYDVERVVTDTAAAAVTSVLVVLVFVSVILVITTTTPIDASSALPAVVATLAGVATARVTYLGVRRVVARRLNRDQYDAVETVRAGLAEPSPDLDAVIAAALGSSARVLYPTEAGDWVTVSGRPAAPGPASVDVRRHGAVVATVDYDADEAVASTVTAVAAAAAAEIDNVALRARLARQVEEVSESRGRLTSAHLEERRRIERDLHDGAQQRLLAIALQLQSARVNGQPNVLRKEVDRAVHDLASTVAELRDLAAGLQPAALANGGLLAAVVDLAGRAPLEVSHQVVQSRFDPDVESAAWFVVSEAVTNVVKHASTHAVTVSVSVLDSSVVVRVSDHGRGGANPLGHGLQGLADRVGAAGGHFAVAELDPHGTVVEAVIPCGS